MKLPRFDISRSGLELLNPIHRSLFEIQFECNSNEKLLSEQVVGYEVINGQIIIKFNLNEETCIEQLDEYESISKIDLYWHNKTGEIITGMEFIGLDLKYINHKGHYRSQELHIIEVIWDFDNTSQIK